MFYPELTDPQMVDLVFIPTSTCRPSPEAAQIPKNGNDTRFPWGLIILRVASVQSCAVCTEQRGCSTDSGGAVRLPGLNPGSTASSGMSLSLSTEPWFPKL